MIDKDLLIKRIRHDSDCWASTWEVDELAKAVDYVVIWHPYPKEKPTLQQPISSDFLVTYHTEQYGSHVCVDTWHEGHFDRYDKYVVAWAELPKPYEEANK